MTDARIISGSLVDAKNVGVHKSLRLIIDVPQERAMEVIEKLGWPTQADPIPVAVARLSSAAATEDTTAASAAYAHTQTQPAPVHAPTVPPARVRPPAQLAGILCAKPAFWKFAQEHGHPEVVGEETAKLYIRAYCGVASRADIKPGTEAEQRLNLMLSAFKVWDLAPSCGAAA